MTLASRWPDTAFLLHELQTPGLALTDSPLYIRGMGKDQSQQVSSLRSAMVQNVICISATHSCQLPARTPPIIQTHSTCSRTGMISTMSWLLSLSHQLFPKAQIRRGIQEKSTLGDNCNWACWVPAPPWHSQCCQPQPSLLLLCTQHFRNQAWLIEQTPILWYDHSAPQLGF